MSTSSNSPPADVLFYAQLAPVKANADGIRAMNILHDYLGVIAYYLRNHASGDNDDLQQALANLPALAPAAATQLVQNVEAAKVDQQSLQGLLALLVDNIVPPRLDAVLVEPLASLVWEQQSDAKFPSLTLIIAINRGNATAQLGMLSCSFSVSQKAVPAPHFVPTFTVSGTAKWTAYALLGNKLDDAESFIAAIKSQGRIDDISSSANFIKITKE